MFISFRTALLTGLVVPIIWLTEGGAVLKSLSTSDFMVRMAGSPMCRSEGDVSAGLDEYRFFGSGNGRTDGLFLGAKGTDGAAIDPVDENIPLKKEEIFTINLKG